MTSYYSDHQHPQTRKPEQSLYMKIAGTSLTTTHAQRNHTSGLQGSTFTNTTEKVSHQIAKSQLNIQTKNQPYRDQSHPNQAKTNYPHKPAHLSLTKISAGLPHHRTKTPPPEANIDNLHHQTNITLALLLFSRNNNRPQQIWRLRLLRLQQQQLLSDLAHHQQTPPDNQPRVTLDLNESPIIYTTPCAETHQPLEDLEGLADLEDPEDQERLKDPLQQYLRQPRQEETPMTGLWKPSLGIRRRTKRRQDIPQLHTRILPSQRQSTRPQFTHTQGVHCAHPHPRAQSSHLGQRHGRMDRLLRPSR
jgi:hypothetical protein